MKPVLTTIEQPVYQQDLMRARTLFAQADAGYKEGCEYLLKAKAAGASQREIAKAIERSQAWVNRVLKWHADGCDAAGPFAADHELHNKRLAANQGGRFKAADAARARNSGQDQVTLGGKDVDVGALGPAARAQLAKVLADDADADDDAEPAAGISPEFQKELEEEKAFPRMEAKQLQPKPKIDRHSLEVTRKRVEALGPEWELQQPSGRQRQYIIHEPEDWNGKCGLHVIRCRTLEIVNDKVDEIEKISATATLNELEQLKTENEKLKSDVENIGRMWRANFQTVLEAGGIPRELYIAVVNCLHPDKPPPTAEQRAAAFALFQNWKQKLERASRDA
jgi:hypothetical protein